ncbi:MULTISPECIES: DUF922 domain-containing protein [Mesonia]|uniref:Uncharacterized protein n=1 Tax=Mesonia oceanica TaxID=2687242 RepID=A0AC61Y631_9FLAO|nr:MULTISPECIES: DUF922 domain-containing protein [Mesonia]MAN27236.1 DUF922 domain-containing protein [Mesonia sp.]MAQ42368.1 DUF922 domain-containing protein [Mesonia sp.]MBJ98656.1 DUF922 domain-containing protein [Flavobacteriaceae bacterium]VVU99926.1 hypothetical protein FVB9532_01187 [Mesonia oceanica]|tara:strand:- start:1581 stop:2126 length:546 start_codon:yes stop_codon:yes gene_type:complete
MNKILLLSFLFFSMVFIGKAQERVAWSSNKLTWEDFKGKPLRSSPFKANANSGFSYKWSVKTVNDQPEFVYEVKSYFYPEESWVKDKKASQQLLAHEQLHFDISELYARKMRKALAGFQVSTSITQIKSSLNKLHRSIERERVKTQELYDKETNHGMIPTAQEKWQKFVDTALEKLSDYRF